MKMLMTFLFLTGVSTGCVLIASLSGDRSPQAKILYITWVLGIVCTICLMVREGVL